jgi:uncharacterized protein
MKADMAEKPTRDKRWVMARASQALDGNSNVLFAYLFGSWARDAVTPLSDIDIAVYLREAHPDAEDKLAILGELADHLETDDIDLVVLNSAPLTLQARVVRDRQVLVDRQPYVRHAFESLVMRKYFDFSIFETSILNRRFSLGG